MSGKNFIYCCVVIIVCCLMTVPVCAEEIVLKNGDHIQGEIVSDSPAKIIFKTQAMGEVVIDRAFVVNPEYAEPVFPKQEETPVAWGRQLSAGYGQSGGNTVNSKANLDVLLNRKTEHNELTLKGSVLYSSNDHTMDSQKWFTSARYAVSFGRDLAWYRLVKVEVDHDRFSNIDHRVVPSAGIGYWFSDELPLKLLTEMSLGYEKTWYRSGSGHDGETTLMPRVFFEKTLFEPVRFVQDATGYLAVSDAEKYRIHSETSLVYDLSDRLSWRWSFVDDYNAVSTGAKKNDYSWITAIDYRF